MEFVSSKMFDEVYNIVSSEIIATCNNLEFTKKVYIYRERTFVGLKQIDPNAIYIVVHFNRGTLMVGGIILPITIEILSEINGFEQAHNLLLDFATNYNFKVPTSNSYIQQVYTTPEIADNFNEQTGDIRSLMYTNGTIVYGEELSAFTSVKIDGKDVLFTNVRTGLDITPNTADLGNNNNRTTTVNKFGVFTLTLNVISEQTELVSKVDGFIFGTTNLNEVFNVTFTKNGIEYTKSLKLTSANISQELGGIPSYALSFTE